MVCLVRETSSIHSLQSFGQDTDRRLNGTVSILRRAMHQMSSGPTWSPGHVGEEQLKQAFKSLQN